MITLSVEEFAAKAKSQNVPKEHVCFICPICGSLQSAQDLINVKAGSDFNQVCKYLGFSCVGRFTHMKPATKYPDPQYGCDWTLGGLFQFHDLQVITSNGKAHPHFMLVSSEHAISHMKGKLFRLDIKNMTDKDYA